MVQLKTLKQLNGRVQSLLVSKKHYPRLKDALNHLEKMGHDLTKIKTQVDETEHYYRFRQIVPNSKKFTYRTERIGNQGDLAIVQTPQKTDSRGNTWTPNIVDKGSYKIDTNQPSYYVPNKVMQDQSKALQPRSSIINTRPVIGGNPNTWTPQKK